MKEILQKLINELDGLASHLWSPDNEEPYQDSSLYKYVLKAREYLDRNPMLTAKEIYKFSDRHFRKERNQDKIRPKFFTAVINIKSYLKTYMPNVYEHYMVCEMLRRVKRGQYEPEYGAISWLLKDEHIRQYAYYPFKVCKEIGEITTKLTIVERNHQTKDIYFSMYPFEYHNWMPMYALHNRTHHVVDLPF